MGIAARLDNFPRRHTWLGFPVAVVYKFIDDQGAFRVLTAREVRLADLMPGAVGAAVAVQALQTVGTFLASRWSNHKHPCPAG